MRLYYCAHRIHLAVTQLAQRPDRFTPAADNAAFVEAVPLIVALPVRATDLPMLPRSPA